PKALLRLVVAFSPSMSRPNRTFGVRLNGRSLLNTSTSRPPNPRPANPTLASRASPEWLLPRPRQNPPRIMHAHPIALSAMGDLRPRHAVTGLETVGCATPNPMAIHIISR